MKLLKFFGSLALATASTAAIAAAATPAMVRPADFKAEADVLLAASFPADGPGAAVVATRRGEVIYAAGRGLADLEKRRPITPDTVFKLGSIAKQFTAAMVLQLVADGRISLDDPVARFFPSFPQPGAGATVRQLLNHMSGIHDYTKVPGWIVRAGTRPFTTADLIAEASKLGSKSEPGTSWEYNNTGYMMLGAIVEKVTDKAWHEVLAERITRPLGLRSIAYGPLGEPTPGIARGYTNEKGETQLAGSAHPSLGHAAGGLVGSSADLAKWAQALHHGRVVSPALYQEMIRPARLADGSTQPYGFGLRLRQIRGRLALVHGGAGRGLDTDSVYVPSEDLFVAVFANSDKPATDPSSLTRRLAALALGRPVPAFTRADADPAALEPLFGSYGGATGKPTLFFSRGGKLFLGRGDEEREVFAAGGDRFFFGPGELTWFRLIRPAAGAPPAIEIHSIEGAEPERAVRTGALPRPVAVPAAVLQSYLGTFQTETLVLTVSPGENGWLTITPAGQPPMPLRPVSTTEFRIDRGNMRVVFHPENGEVNRLTVHRGARVLNGQRTGR
ncbi:MAG: beta-lactamase family protein [Pseudomonadota bacterium]|nr:beta-lactamase family protein [Pseudomonadota bacterium]